MKALKPTSIVNPREEKVGISQKDRDEFVQGLNEQVKPYKSLVEQQREKIEAAKREREAGIGIGLIGQMSGSVKKLQPMVQQIRSEYQDAPPIRQNRFQPIATQTEFPNFSDPQPLPMIPVRQHPPVPEYYQPRYQTQSPIRYAPPPVQQYPPPYYYDPNEGYSPSFPPQYQPQPYRQPQPQPLPQPQFQPPPQIQAPPTFEPPKQQPKAGISNFLSGQGETKNFNAQKAFNQFRQPEDETVWDHQERRRAEYQQSLEEQIAFKKKQKEEEKRLKLEEDMRFEEKIKRDLEEIKRQEELEKQKAKDKEDLADQVAKDLLKRKEQEEEEKRLAQEKRKKVHEDFIKKQQEDERKNTSYPNEIDSLAADKSVQMTKQDFKQPQNDPIGDMKGLIGSFVDQVALQQKQAQLSIEHKLNKIQEETLNEHKYRSETKQELLDLKKLIAEQQKQNQDTLWDHSSRSAHFRFDVLKDIRENELPSQPRPPIRKATLLPPKRLNVQFADTIKHDQDSGIFDDLERKDSDNLDREMAQKPQWENDALTDQMQFVNKINQKQNEFAYLNDFDALDKKYKTPQKIENSKQNMTVNFDGYFGQNSQSQYMSPAPQRKNLKPYESAAPKSGNNQARSYTPIGDYGLQSSQVLDFNNRPHSIEHLNAEQIRQRNNQRLAALKDIYSHQIENERGTEFSNIREPQTLTAFDSNLSKLLTPTPSHSKSEDLLGRSYLRNVGAMSMKKDYGLKSLEEKYLDQSPIIEQMDDIYDIPLTRTLIIS